LLFGTGISSLLTPSGALEDHAIVQMPMDIGPELRAKQVSNFPKPSIMGPTVAQDGGYHEIGTILQWYTLDEEIEGELLLTDFELREIGTTAEIWVQVDMSYPDNRDVPVITDEQVTYMLAELTRIFVQRIPIISVIRIFMTGVMHYWDLNIMVKKTAEM